MERIEINLASDKYRRSIIPLALAIGLLAVAVSFTWYDWSLFSSNRDLIAKYTARISGTKGAPISGKDLDLKILKRDVDFINEAVAKKTFLWTELLSDLEATVPPGVQIVQISPEFKEGKVRIAGLSRSMGDVFAMLDSMGRSGHFREVFLIKHSEDKKGARSSGEILFEISSGYAQGGKL